MTALQHLIHRAYLTFILNIKDVPTWLLDDMWSAVDREYTRRTDGEKS